MRPTMAPVERALRKLAATTRQLRKNDDETGHYPAKVVRRAHRQRYALLHEFAELSDPTVYNDPEAIEELADLWAEKQQRRRIDRWRQKLAEDKSKLRDWVRHGPKPTERTYTENADPDCDRCAKHMRDEWAALWNPTEQLEGTSDRFHKLIRDHTRGNTLWKQRLPALPQKCCKTGANSASTRRMEEMDGTQVTYFGWGAAFSWNWLDCGPASLREMGLHRKFGVASAWWRSPRKTADGDHFR